jgi:SAM-dependent methyltransferase
MKIRDSGMPEEEVWSSFFNPVQSLRRLGFQLEHEDVVDMGCGYGTFSIAAAQLTKGTVHALDVDADMIAATSANAQRNGLHNVVATQRDFIGDGTGLVEGSVGYAMLFNVLHAEDPQSLLREAFRVLAVGGTVAVMHWIADERTPRGPALSIRPRPEQCLAWLRASGFKSESQVIDLPPFHYGLFARRSD